MVIHDVGAKHPEHSIVAIENGHVTGRKVGDGASHVVLEQVRQADAQPSDHLSYLTKTPDGKILKSSTPIRRKWIQLGGFLERRTQQ